MAVSANNDSCAPFLTGGYDCEFVQPPPDFLQCRVCMLPFRDPSLLSCCGYKGCAPCIGRIEAAGHPCPICQQPFHTMLEKELQRKVLNLRVFCSEKEEGCRWEGELRDLEVHSRRNCAYVEDECRYGCGVRYQRRFLRDHEIDECPQRPPEVFTQSLVRKMVERIDKLDKAHEEDQSKLAAVQAKLAGVEQHIQQLQNENTSLQDEKEKMSGKIEELICQQQEVIEKTHDEQAKLTQQIQQLQQQNTSLQDEKEKMTRKMGDIEGQLQQELDEDKARICELQEEKRKLSKKIDDLENQVHQQCVQLRPLIAQSPGWLMDPKGTLSSPHPPCIMIMPRFSQCMKNDDQWYSKPFYSEPGGYKLCLQVYPNGIGNGKGTHISVFVRLSKGENDPHIEWPFEHSVTFSILNWKKDDDHVIRTTNFKDAAAVCKERVESKEWATGWGNRQFLPHASLSDTADVNKQYLHNDCLCLQVLKVEPPK